MAHVQTESSGCEKVIDELLHTKFRKRSDKHNDSIVEKRAVKRHKKHKPRQRKATKLIKSSSCGESDFVSSSRRLTRRIGLFSNGKISTKVSRFEHTASAETKARVEQDLHKILNLACNNHGITVQSDKSQVHRNADVSNKSCSCQHESVDNAKENSAVQHASPVSCDVAKSCHNSSKIFNSCDENTEDAHSSQTKNLGTQTKCNYSSRPKIQLSSVITRLHMTLNKKREELFPRVSLKNILKNELAALQRHFSMSRTDCSSTESFSCSGPSQPNTSPHHRETNLSLKSRTADQDDHQSEASFKLDFHPDSLPCSSSVKDWLFSVSTKNDEIFANQEKVHGEEQLIYHGAMGSDPYSSPGSPFKRKPNECTSVNSASPGSDRQPAWKAHYSPCRPPVESPTSSWNYSRCKMY